MARLIDAEHLAWNVKGIKSGKLTVKHLLWILENQEPAIDAEPVRHGKWIRHEWAEEANGYLIDNYECSLCKYWGSEKTDYCPNCGAKMEEKE